MLVRPTPLKATRAVRAAFTLLEVLVVVAIIVMLAGVGGYYVVQRYEEAKVNKARIDAEGLSQQLQTYIIQNNMEADPPQSVEVLTQPGPNTQPFVPPDKILDPWRQVYQVQYGADGKPYVFTMYKGNTIGNIPQ